MRTFGLIGYPLSHSFSQKYFTEKFAREGISDARYELFPLSNVSELPDLLHRHPDFCGLNVTIPYKTSVIPYLHTLDTTAQAVGAVNCIRIHNSLLTGFNTDIVGFEQSLRQVLTNRKAQEGAQALILGTGGAAKAVAWVLKNMNIPYLFVSRQPEDRDQILYETIAGLSPAVYRIVINTTPLGTYPNVNECPPIPFDWLQPEHLVYDLVYNPPETLLLRLAAERGCMVKNGLEMLHLQAKAAWRIWSDQ